MHATTIDQAVASDGSRAKKMIRRLGVAGFAFFFIKGMLWLLIPTVLWMFRG